MKKNEIIQKFEDLLEKLKKANTIEVFDMDVSVGTEIKSTPIGGNDIEVKNGYVDISIDLQIYTKKDDQTK